MTAIKGPSALGPQGYVWAEHWARERKAAQLYIDNAKRYWAWAPVLGLRPEVLFAHHGKETNLGRFGGVLDPSFHNCAGIKKATGGGDFDPNAHERFASWEDGVMAHVNHFAAYVYGLNFIPIGTPHGRLHLVQTRPWAGEVDQVEELDGRWAPSPTYGRDLVRNFVTPMVTYGESGIAYVRATHPR